MVVRPVKLKRDATTYHIAFIEEFLPIKTVCDEEILWRPHLYSEFTPLTAQIHKCKTCWSSSLKVILAKLKVERERATNPHLK